MNDSLLAVMCGCCGKSMPPSAAKGRPRRHCFDCRPARDGITRDQPAYVFSECGHCHKSIGPFVPSKVQRFCSTKCYALAITPEPDHKCPVCGIMFRRRIGGAERKKGASGPVNCSNKCAGIARGQAMKGIRRVSPEEAADRLLDKKRKKEAARIQRQEEASRRKTAEKDRLINSMSSRPCKACGKPLGIANHRRNVCSDACLIDIGRAGRRREKQAYRARKRLATVERFLDIEIFKRDAWKCLICGKTTPEPLIGSNEPDAPTIDHIIALAKGGEHSRANVQCACRQCNSMKRDLDMADMVRGDMDDKIQITCNSRAPIFFFTQSERKNGF